MFPTPSNVCYIVFEGSFLQLGYSFRSIPYTTTALFKISSFSSHFPWTYIELTSTVSIKFEQSQSTSSICTQF